MKKLITLTILSFMFFYSPINAKDSCETDINSKIKDFYIIANTPLDEKTHLLIDYAIEIIKHDLESINCYYVIYGLFNLSTDNKILAKKYNVLKNYYNDKIINLNDDFAEKIVLISLANKDLDKKEDNSFEGLILDILQTNLIICSDKKKTAIISLLLAQYNRIFADKFIKNYPHHSATPFIKLWKLTNEKNDSSTYISQINEWIKNYGELNTPLGWKYKINAWFELANHYIEIKDYKTSKELIKKIIIEAPDYLLGDHKLTCEGFVSGSVEIEINSGIDL